MKSSKEWKDLVEKYGEARALLHFNKQIINGSPMEEIERQVKTFSQSESIPSQFDKALNLLSKRFKFPYRVIYAPDEKWRGKYLYDGNTRIVVVNSAHADVTTPFHEYYHPAVRILYNKNQKLFESILAQARLAGYAHKEAEEAVVEFLAAKAVAKGFDFYMASFLDFVKRVFGIKTTLSSATKLSEVLAILNRSNVDISGETTLFEAFKNMDEMVRTIRGTLRDRPDEVRPDFLSILEKEFVGVSTSDTSDFYQDKAGNNLAKRLSAFVADEFSTRIKNRRISQSQWAAIEIFSREGITVNEKTMDTITDRIMFQGLPMSFKDVVAEMDKVFARQRLYGKMVHAYIQYLVENDPQKKAAAKTSALQYAKDYGEPFISLETHPDLVRISENLNSIMETAGIFIPTVETLGVPREKFDRIASEIVYTSDIIQDSDGNNIGTTADGLIQHENGDFSLVDWKTGNITSDMTSPILLEYGEKLGIPDSKLSRAYLELAIRALMLKAKFPNATFRNIQLVKIDKQGHSRAMKLDLELYLHLIENYVKATNAAKHADMSKDGLFDVHNYRGAASSIVRVFDQIKNLPFEDQLQYLKTQLSALYQRRSKEEVESDPILKKQSKLYTEAILELEKVHGTNLDSQTKDLPYLGKGFKNFSDIANPKVQALHKIVLAAKDKVTAKMTEYSAEHDKLFKAVANESAENRRKVIDTLASISAGISIFTLQPWLFGATLIAYKLIKRGVLPKTSETFAFMWRESTDPHRPGMYLNTTNQYILNGKVQQMTEAQKNYRDFVYATMRREYKAMASQVVGYKFDNPNKPLYKSEALGIPAELPEDFMPRIPKPLEELREDEIQQKGFMSGVMGIKTSLNHRAKVFLTSFIEDQFENKANPIPLKFFMHSNSSIVENKAHSLNAEAAFKMFLGNVLYKQHMDEVYDLYVGTTNAISDERDELGNKKYPQLTDWLNDTIYTQVLQRSKSTDLMTRNWRLKVGNFIHAVTGLPKNTELIISQDRMLRLLKSMTTFTVMAYKIWGPVRNTLVIGLSNLSKTTQPIFSSIVGISPDGVDNMDIKGARDVFKDYIAKKMVGKEDDSKLWNLAKKFSFLPDNLPYQVSQHGLLSQSIKMSGTSHAYMFYQMGENFGALWHLAALARATKITTAEGKTMSVWDAYDDHGNWIAGKRGEVQIANGVTQDLYELDTLEMKTFRRAYEQLQGSYRQEEKTALEATVIGDFIFQFKKYFYQFMKVLYGSPYKDVTMGKYVLTGKKPDGMPTYQWHSEVFQGQMTVLAGSLLAFPAAAANWVRGEGENTMKVYLNEKIQGTSNTIQGSRKRALASLLNTGLWFVMLLVLFNGFFDDDDDDTFLARELERTLHDVTRGASYKDVFDTMEKPIVAAQKISDLGNAAWAFMTDGIRGKTTKDGWLKGSKTLLRATPFMSGYMQLQDVFKDDHIEDQGKLFGIVPR